MAFVNFAIPEKISDLLNTSFSGHYFVGSVRSVRELSIELANAKKALREEGVEFIFSCFDIFFSVLHHSNSLTVDLINKTYINLHKAMTELNKNLSFLLEDKDNINDEVKNKYVNIVKMIVYLYTETVQAIEQKLSLLDSQKGLLKRRKPKKSTDEDKEQFEMVKSEVLLVLNNLIQQNISLFWEPDSIEDNFLNCISNICYQFLQNSSIKNEKDDQTHLFNIFGNLIKSYQHGSTFIIRITQLIKIHDHLTVCVPKGIQQIVENFNCKGLLHDLIEELTEWQSDDQVDSQGARFCSQIVSTLAALLPNLMVPEVMFLNTYLHKDPPALRISVLTVMMEIILNNLTKADISDDQREFRDELFEIILEHCSDVSVFVRAKVFQHWTKLQKESAIPLKFQSMVLGKAVAHVNDKGAMARKAAANCVTAFMSYNCYSANLSLKDVCEEFENKKDEFKKMREEFIDEKMEKLMSLQKEWDEKKNKLKIAVEEGLNTDEHQEVNDENNTSDKLPVNEVIDKILNFLKEYKFDEAVSLCRDNLDEVLTQFQDSNFGEVKDVNFHMNLFHAIFFNIPELVQQVNSKKLVKELTVEESNKFFTLEKQIEAYQMCKEFLVLMDQAIDQMDELLVSTSPSDMQEAIEFFIAAYKFNIDRSTVGILSILKLMQRIEQDRKDAATKAFEKIFLHTNATNPAEHSSEITKNLVRLVKTIPALYIDDLQDIISNWSSKGTLDNLVIDTLWRYFTLKIPVSEKDSCAAAELLRMASIGKKSIISRNIALVTSITISERQKNLQFLASCCRLLTAAAEKVDINSNSPPFTFTPEEPVFENILNVLTQQFFEPVHFYHKVIIAGIEFIYKLCSKPEYLCEKLMNGIVGKLSNNENGDYVPHYVLVRLCQLVGYIAVMYLQYLDETVYKEMKRRHNNKENTNKKEKPNNKSRMSALSFSKNPPNLSASLAASQTMDESVLEGAQAEDVDAEFITNVLENQTVSDSTGFGKLVKIIASICKQGSLYTNKEVQTAAITGLMRCMLVSSKCCLEHIRLVFTIFEKTSFPEVRSNILIHFSDLLIRFPNIIEPWSPRVFHSLQDSAASNRLETFHFLSCLILRDMIRSHSHVPKMAVILADPNEELRSMCKTFFIKLSHKEINFYSILPDIFGHLIISGVSEENLQNIMKTLFELVQSAKHMENLVERFCSKFTLTLEVSEHRNISYCLSLIQYNERALRKLLDSFQMFKNVLHNEEVYAHFNLIMQNCSKQQPGKPDLKPIVAELEEQIRSVFEVNEDGQPRLPIAPITKTKPKQTKKKKGSNRKKANNYSDEESNDSCEERNQRNRNTKTKKRQPEMSSDSE